MSEFWRLAETQIPRNFRVLSYWWSPATEFSDMRAEKLVFPGPSNLSLWAVMFVNFRSFRRPCPSHAGDQLSVGLLLPNLAKPVHVFGVRQSIRLGEEYPEQAVPHLRDVRVHCQRDQGPVCGYLHVDWPIIGLQWLAFLYFAALRP